MIIVVAELVKNYEISTGMKNVEINPLISLKPKEVRLKFNKRKRPNSSA